MKLSQASRSTRRARFEPLFALLVAVAILSSATSIAGTGGGSPRRPGTPGVGSDMNYDEGVGSLPVEKAPEPNTPIGDLVPDWVLGPNGLVRPFVTLRGSLGDLDSVILDATGKGVGTLHPPAVLGGPWTLGFHGNVDIDLDAAELLVRDVEVFVRIGGEFEGGIAAAFWNGQSTPIVVLDEPLLELPLSQMLGSGYFHQSDVGLLALSSFQTKAHLEFELLANRLRISQRID